MAAIRDLSILEYLPCSAGLGLIAIGWLEQGRPFSTGKVSKKFFTALCDLLQKHWSVPVAFAGVHFCSLCQFTGGKSSYEWSGVRFSGASCRELFVPRNGLVYVAPENIAHYVDAHRYAPPRDFQEAVLKCPEIGSKTYIDQLLATPVRIWIERCRNNAP
jgi:hypothetical protein